MVFDPLSPIAPARVKALILPLGQVKRARFETFVQRLYPEHVVRLGDISPDRRPDRNMFSPLAFPAGMIVYDFTTSLPPTSHLALAPFELYRAPLVILAIADGSELDHVSCKDKDGNETNGYDYQTHLQQIRDLDQELETVRDQYPKALVHQALLFDYHHQKESQALPGGLIPVPSVKGSTITTMKTIMCDLSSVLLAELTTMAKSLQGMAMIESPSVVLDGRQGPGYSWSNGDSGTISRRASQYGTPDTDSRSMSSMPKGDRSQVRMSMPVRFGSQQGEHLRSASVSRPTTPSAGPHTPSDGTSSAMSPPLSRSNSVADKIQEQSRDRISTQGFGSGSLSERSRNKGKGRVSIAIGGLYLQAGRWQDAIKELVEGAYIAKTNNDHLWHAKALEGLVVAMIMLAWIGLDFQIPQLCYVVPEKSPNPTAPGTAAEQHAPETINRLAALQNLSVLLPELLDRILNLYERASNFTGESLPQLPFSESAIRFSKLLSAVHLAGGRLDNGSLQLVVLGTPFFAKPNTRSPRLNIHPTRSVIVTTLFRAFPSSAAAKELSLIDRTVILAGIASVLGFLGYDRKKAMVMRELVSILIPGLVSARIAGAAEMGIHPAAGLAALSHINGNTTGAGALDLGEGDVESGMDALLGLVGKTYGVVGFPCSSSDDAKNGAKVCDDSDEAVVARIMENTAARQFGGKSMKMNVLRACIGFCEALPDFQGVLRFSADLLRTAGTGIAPGPRTDNASPMMARDEQVRLSINISRTVDAAAKIGLQDIEAEYWDEFLVRGVELEALPASRTPNPHRSSDLGGTAKAKEAGGKNPFIYNPFLKRPNAGAVERLLVCGESATFKVTLQNPYEFDIVIDRIRLEANGGEFESAVQETIVGPYRTQILSVSGAPRSAGAFKITGCIVKLRGCRERRFPIFLEPWSPHSDIKVKALGLAVQRRREERPVSDASLSKRPAIDPHLPKTSCLSLTAIAPQPIVVITSTSLSQAAAMVLEGERQTFSVTLKNLSITTPVDLLLFSFQDSTQGPLQTALSKRDASPAELYEYELILSRKAALRYVKKEGESDETNIPPGSTKTVDFEVLGKPGLTSAAVLIDYAHLGQPASKVKGPFHTRQVSLPITVTVNAGVELSRIDLLPLGHDVPSNLWSLCGEAAKEDTEDIDARDYCLLVLDLRNAWPAPLRARLEIGSGRAIEEEILPGSTSRVVFPIKRIFLDDPHKAIPVLDPARQRQFVVSSGRISVDSEKASREAFWYREEILRSLSGTWRTTSGTERKGAIELRGMRLVPRTIDALKIEDVGISLRVNGAPPTCTPQTTVEVDDFLHLVVTITNRSATPVYPLLRLQPSLCNHAYGHALDLSKKVVWDGTLQRTLPVLAAHETTEVRVTMTALCKGEFEVGACVEETRLWGVEKERGDFGNREKVGRQRAGTEAMMDALLGARERRVWYAREPLGLRVVDAESDEE
ncbi:hypothetical protein V500_07289 [Pseudogymnoascus sp. VKM F-4518 (FW-2643)]|nr:hypothetical protein V500_07289 [Pseudogymnoascus sp. VKM F-4518 (FW-2643)]